jgi:hypothetical protein
MFVVDTDTLSLLLRAHARVTERVAQATEEVAIMPITPIEILQGRFAFMLKAGKREKLRQASSWPVRVILDLLAIRLDLGPPTIEERFVPIDPRPEIGPDLRGWHIDGRQDGAGSRAGLDQITQLAHGCVRCVSLSCQTEWVGASRLETAIGQRLQQDGYLHDRSPLHHVVMRLEHRYYVASRSPTNRVAGSCCGRATNLAWQSVGTEQVRELTLLPITRKRVTRRSSGRLRCRRGAQRLRGEDNP